MLKNTVIVLPIAFLVTIGVIWILAVRSPSNYFRLRTSIVTPTAKPSHPLAIETMRRQSYPGSAIVIEEQLADGSNYHQYITSYKSEGLKIYALLTVPNGPVPRSPAQRDEVGWPVILFNHGYIPPEVYRTNERYVAYVDEFARNGYIVFKPDYRGNGFSEGKPEGAYYSPAYTVDVLNALASIKKYKSTDSNRIGIWGHSLGGNIALRVLVIKPNDVKAAVIWGGVVGSYDDLMNNWQRRVPYQPSTRELTQRNNNRQNIVQKYGTPKSNPSFWNTIDPTYFIKDITVPVQLNHGTEDEEVPVVFSQSLRDKLKDVGKTVEYYEYPEGDHNISQDFNEAMANSLRFFDKYLK